MILIEYAVIGFVSSCVLIFTAKVVMAKLLQRDDNYYDNKPDDGGDANE